MIKSINKFSCLAALLVFLSCLQSSTQQLWKNEKISRQWQPLVGSGFGGPGSGEKLNGPSNNYGPPPPPPPAPVENNYGFNPPAPQPPVNLPRPPVNNSPVLPPAPQPGPPPAHGNFYNPAPVEPVYQPQPHPHPQPAPYPQQEIVEIVPVPQHHPYPQPHPVAVPIVPQPISAYQQPVLSNTGETIIETLIAGIPFDCRGRPTGHWRDSKFCDVFHACVYGQQRKTYACPIVGERTYFDEVTKRCEFLTQNACGNHAFYK